VKFAVIGTNRITDQFLDAGTRCEEFELHAVLSRTEERAEAYAKAHGAKQAFWRLEDLAACPDVEAVYIASPNALHMQHATAMLSASKHVLCEKPTATNKLELLQMLRTADRHGVLFLEAIRPAFSPSMAVLWDRLPEIGAPRRAAFTYCRRSARYDEYLEGRIASTFDPELSGGALMDLGVYCVHMMLRLFGKPRKIMAACVKLDNGVDGAGSILGCYDDLLAELSYSKINGTTRHSEIQGEDGSVTLSELNALREIRLHLPDGVQDITPPLSENDMEYELRTFIRMAENGTDASEEHNLSVDVMEVLDEVRRQCGLGFPADSWFKMRLRERG
jgi:predicted dehydrogenase